VAATDNRKIVLSYIAAAQRARTSGRDEDFAAVQADGPHVFVEQISTAYDGRRPAPQRRGLPLLALRRPDHVGEDVPQQREPAVLTAVS